jgi:hypothetical protein
MADRDDGITRGDVYRREGPAGRIARCRERSPQRVPASPARHLLRLPGGLLRRGGGSIARSLQPSSDTRPFRSRIGSSRFTSRRRPCRRGNRSQDGAQGPDLGGNTESVGDPRPYPHWFLSRECARPSWTVRGEQRTTVAHPGCVGEHAGHQVGQPRAGNPWCPAHESTVPPKVPEAQLVSLSALSGGTSPVESTSRDLTPTSIPRQAAPAPPQLGHNCRKVHLVEVKAELAGDYLCGWRLSLRPKSCRWARS